MYNPLWEHDFRISLGTSAERREAASTISKLVEGNEEDWCQKKFGPKGKSLRCSHFYHLSKWLCELREMDRSCKVWR